MNQYIEYLSGLSAKQLTLMLAKQKLADTAPLAVLGSGCRFPGGVDSIDRLWQSLLEGEVHTGHYPIGPPGVDGQPRWQPDKLSTSSALTTGAYLTDLDQSANPLGLDEEELLYMDPQQRLLLDCTLDALHQAGLACDVLRGQKVGVFVGISAAEYLYASLNNGLDDEHLSPFMGTGTALSAAPGRIAMLLESEGPAMVVDSACSSAICALHQAKQALRSGECDWAVVGASHLLLSPYTAMVFDKANMLSKQGVARVFDAQADGHVRGEGAGVILLTRKEVMQTHGLSPLAWVRGTAVHQQGWRPAMSVSTGGSQQQVIRQALQDADLTAEDIYYVEAQATGAKLGAQVEIENLRAAYRREAPLYVSSAKANFGHLEPASGMLSLLKAIAVMRHRTVPAQVNLERLADEISTGKGHLIIATEHVALPADTPLYCGISSFGFTGTNTHAVLASGESDAGNPQPRAADAKSSVWPKHNLWR